MSNCTEDATTLPQVIIMAGGKGVRLRPLTLELPKPLCPLLGKPTLFYLFELLKRHGYKNATLTTGYKARVMQQALFDYSGLSLTLVNEEIPLGTAGGVRAAWDKKSDVLVLSGDGLCDFDLTAALKAFKERDCDGLIITSPMNDPREYGLVETDSQDRILSFKEKPAYSSCSGDAANTGIYILSKRVLSGIKPCESSDFGSSVFPRLLKERAKLFGFPQSGYWCDMGDINGYIQCQTDLLNGRVSSAKIEGIATVEGVFADEGVIAQISRSGGRIIPPVYIGKRVKIGPNSVIGPNAVLQDDVTIAKDCEISGSIIGKGSMIGSSVELVGMVCGNAATISDNARAETGSVLGAHATLFENAVLTAGVRVFDGLEVEEGFILRSDLTRGKGAPLQFGEEGLSGLCGVVITPQVCSELGSGLAGLCKNGAVGIGCTQAAASVTMFHAIAAGVAAAGENVWSFGALPLSVFEFCMQKSGLFIGVYIDGGKVTTLRVVKKSGLPISRRDERLLEAALNHSEYRRASASEMGGITELHELKKLYRVELLKACDSPLTPFSINISCRSQPLLVLLSEVLQTLCARVSEEGEVSVTLTPDGKQVSLKDTKGTTLSHEQILALCCLFEFKRGEDVAIPFKAPDAIETLAHENQCQLHRYAECPCDDEDGVARKKAMAKPYLRDGMLMLIKLLSYLSANGLSLAAAAALLPPFVTAERVVSFSSQNNDKGILALIRELKKTGSETAAEGFILKQDGKRAYLRPLKSGRGILVYAESSSGEKALEAADFFEKIVKQSL